MLKKYLTAPIPRAAVPNSPTPPKKLPTFFLFSNNFATKPGPKYVKIVLRI
jgi:hypothetical protein